MICDLVLGVYNRLGVASECPCPDTLTICRAAKELAAITTVESEVQRGHSHSKKTAADLNTALKPPCSPLSVSAA